MFCFENAQMYNYYKIFITFSTNKYSKFIMKDLITPSE